MTFLAKEFFQDLIEEKVTVDEFVFANRQVCKANRFFPVMADILTFVTQHRDQEYALYLADLKWRRDNEWKKNYPELLSREGRIALGVPVEAIEAAVDRGDIDKKDLQFAISSISDKFSMR